MGQFRIEITAVGGHGCQRTLKTGEVVKPCGNATCPDCKARAFVADLQANGCSIENGILTHWPGSDSEATDDLKTGTRLKPFRDAAPVTAPTN